jgi:hypothetical protein
MGTPLMLAEIIHLTVGNAVIGIFEGLLLSILFKLKKLKTIGLLLLANYFSAWIGLMFLYQYSILPTFHITLENARPFFWLSFLLTWAITMILEFPFIALAFRGKSGWLKKSISGTFITQTASYLLLFGWYSIASVNSLYANTEVIDISGMSMPGNVTLYFISPEDRHLHMRTLTNAEEKIYSDFQIQETYKPFTFEPNDASKSTWNLIVKKQHKIILEGFRAEDIPVARQGDITPYGFDYDWNGLYIPKLGSARDSPWIFKLGLAWASEGLFGRNEITGGKIHIAYDTFFGSLKISQATMLPDNIIIFQLGEDQICIFDFVKRKIAVLTRGMAPVPVISR